MSQLFLIGVALVFIFEGILPFLSPKIWRNMMIKMLTTEDKFLRSFGLMSMLTGVALLYWVH